MKIGLVVPANTIDPLSSDTRVSFKGRTPDSESVNGGSSPPTRTLSGAAPNKRPNRPKSHRREELTDARWLAQEAVTLAHELEALPSGSLPHQLKRAEIEPRARIELMERIISGIKSKRRWT